MTHFMLPGYFLCSFLFVLCKFSTKLRSLKAARGALGASFFFHRCYVFSFSRYMSTPIDIPFSDNSPWTCTRSGAMNRHAVRCYPSCQRLTASEIERKTGKDSEMPTIARLPACAQKLADYRSNKLLHVNHVGENHSLGQIAHQLQPFRQKKTR